MKWICNRLKERSTWLAITCLVTIAGLPVTEDQKELVIQAGLAIGAVIMAFTKDCKNDNTDNLS